jgi:biopolymer transport protein ExbB/TolQ
MSIKTRSVWYLPDRKQVLLGSIIIGVIAIIIMNLVVGNLQIGKMNIGVILLDNKSPQYPFTIQNIMHIFFFIGLGELYVRWRIAQRELSFSKRGFLPEDDETILQSHNLGSIRRAVKSQYDGEHGFLPSLIDLCILQFQSSHSVDQAVSVLNSSLELIAHRVDLRYSFLRYIVWVIPTIGFIGTVIGISSTLSGVNPQSPDLEELTSSLGLSFNTTLIALLLSAVLVLLMHLVQESEEKSVNQAGHYTLCNLINRLYTGK